MKNLMQLQAGRMQLVRVPLGRSPVYADAYSSYTISQLPLLTATTTHNKQRFNITLKLMHLNVILFITKKKKFI